MKLATDRAESSFRMQIEAGELIARTDEFGNFMLPVPLIQASLWVNATRTTFITAQAAVDSIGDRWQTHAERFRIAAWLAERNAADDYEILYYVAVHVLSEWSKLPKRTKRQHRETFGEVAALARSLADRLEETGESYYRGGGYGLRGALVCDLFNEVETTEILQPVEAWNEAHPETMGDNSELVRPARHAFPTMEVVLHRLALAADRIAREGPIHSQPNKRGALNGFFIRRIDRLMRHRYGEVPAGVIAAVASIALNDTIDDDLATKSMNLAERSSPK